MPGSACCLLAAFISSATVVDAAAGVDGEVAVGRAPIQLSDPEQNSVTFTLVPGAGLRLRSKTNTLSLSYTPRIFYRVPNLISVSRPLVLHQVQVADTLLASRTLSWISSGSVSVGELDYTASGILPAGSSAVRTDVVDIVRAEGQTGFRLDVTRRLRWSGEVYGDFTTPLNEDDTPPPTTTPTDPNDPLAGVVGNVPESAQLSGRSSLSYAVSRADRVAGNAEVTYQWFPDTGRFLLLSPDVSWERQLSRETRFSVSGGFAYVITLATPDDTETDDAIGGTGSFRFDSVVTRHRNVRVTTGFGANLDWFFDPIAGTSNPRAGVDGGVNVDIGRSWSISPNASFFTIIRDASTAPGVDGQAVDNTALRQVDATQLRAEIPFTYRATNFLFLNFGLRGSLRGREIQDAGFPDERYEVWAFFGLTVRYSSSNTDPNWLQL